MSQRPRRRLDSLPLALALFLSSATLAIAQPTSTVCSRFGTLSSTHPVVVIDLASGLQTQGKTSFDTGQSVEVHLINANPFAWKYKVAETVTVDPDDLSSFLNAFFPGAVALASPKAPEKAKGDATTTPATTTQTTPPVPGVVPAVCNDAGVAQTRGTVEIPIGLTALKTARAQVIKDLDKLDKAVEAERSALAADIQALSQATDCQTLFVGATSIGTTQLRKIKDLSGKISLLKASLGTLRREILAQERRIDAYADGLYDLHCSPSTVRREVEEVEKNLAAHSSYAEQARSDLAAAGKAQSDLRKLIQGVKETIARPDALGQIFEVTGPDDPGTVTIKIFRKKPADEKFPDKPYVEKQLRFGGRPRFALAVGVAFASLRTRDYASVQGFALDDEGAFVLDDDGERQLTSVVGLEDGSDHRITPLVALHTRIGKPWWIFSGTHLTLGLTAKSDDNLSAEYLAGISFSLAGEKAFLTLGAYNGRVESLRDGFYEGRALPADVAELPVRKDRDWSFAVALSYKLR